MPRANWAWRWFIRPYGTCERAGPEPGDESPGYFHTVPAGTPEPSLLLFARTGIPPQIPDGFPGDHVTAGCRRALMNERTHITTKNRQIAAIADWAA